MRFGLELLGREHYRQEGQQPEQRVVAYFGEQLFHGFVWDTRRLREWHHMRRGHSSSAGSCL
ncbi:MAG: hypothetical protein PVI39_01420, partial [Desulfobacteraceae bacterium]